MAAAAAEAATGKSGMARCGLMGCLILLLTLRCLSVLLLQARTPADDDIYE